MGRSDVQAKRRPNASTMAGIEASQSIESVPDTVTKSAVMNTEVTAGRPRTSAISSGAPFGSVWVVGPPTGTPTVNFIARGFGVGSTFMVTVQPRLRVSHGSARA